MLGWPVRLLDLLRALTSKDQHTTPAIALALGITEESARRELEATEREGWAVEGVDGSRNVPPEFDGQFCHTTADGQPERHRLEDAAGRYREYEP